MPIICQLEYGVIVLLGCILAWMVWKHHHRRLRKLWEKIKAARPRRWRAKSPHDCPACQAGVRLAVQRVRREVAPWSEVYTPAPGYTGHVDATLTRWLARQRNPEVIDTASGLVRAGAHSQRLHDRLFVDLKVPYPGTGVDELHAPVVGNCRHSWLWVAIDPVSQTIPVIHLGTRKIEDAYRFIHDLSLRLAPGWVLPSPVMACGATSLP
jgi:hypothetical protein